MLKLFLFIMTSCAWCCSQAEVARCSVFEVPHEWNYCPWANQPRAFVVRGSLPDGVKSIEGVYNDFGNYEKVDVCDTRGRSLSCVVREAGPGFAGFPVSLKMLAGSEPDVMNAHVAMCSLGASEKLTFMGPNSSVVQRTVTIDSKKFGAVGGVRIRGGETSFSLQKDTMTITRVTNGRGPKSFFVKVIVTYARLNDVVVCWGVHNEQLGSHKFSFSVGQ